MTKGPEDLPDRVLLVLGGTRSGKSRYAVEAAKAMRGQLVHFLATARRGDRELEARITAHRRERPKFWSTREVGLDLAGAVFEVPSERCVLVDSLTLWVASIVEAGESVPARWAAATTAFDARRSGVILVSDEVGLGVVPEEPLGRRFRDELGWLNQQAAADAGEVVFLVAGLPISLRAL